MTNAEQLLQALPELLRSMPGLHIAALQIAGNCRRAVLQLALGELNQTPCMDGSDGAQQLCTSGECLVHVLCW